MNYKKIVLSLCIFTVFCGVFLLNPRITNAQTTTPTITAEDLQVQINALLKQIEQLRAQLAEVGGNQKNPDITNDNIETGKTVLILVDETVLPDLKKELENYTGDIKKELGLDTYIKSVSPVENIHSLKSYVLDFFKTGNLNGVLLIGNIPTGYFYHPDVPTGVFTSEGLSLGDYIYQDFLNACEFSVERNAFSYKNEECQVGVTIQPYWVARLTPNSSNHSDIELLKDYFKRNHELRNGLYAFEQKVLLYQPVILDYKGTEQETINKIKKDLNSFGGMYPPGNYKFIDIFSPSSDSDYLSELPKGYETLIFNGHGTPLFHQKNITPKSQINAKFFFGHFSSCSVGRFTTRDYLAGEYLFSGGLVSLAPSVPVFATSDFNAEFHIMLANGVPFYKAIEWSGIGGNIFGDPTLRMRYNQLKPSQSKIQVSANQLTFSKDNPTHEFVIENVSDSPLYFYVRGKYLKQKNHSHLNIFSSMIDANAKNTDGRHRNSAGLFGKT